MGLFGSIKNTLSCSLSVLGTGSKNCAFEIKLVNGIYAVARGETIADADEFDKDYVQEKIQQGEWVPLIDAIGFLDESADDTIQTTQSGVEIKANLGRYKFTLEYKKGEYFNKAMSSLDSFGKFDIILVDEAGNWLMTENASGVGKGFKAGMFSPLKTKLNDGSVATSKSLTFQLLDRSEWDDRLIWLDVSETGFSPDEADGANDILISFDTAPSNSDTTLVIDLVSTADNSTALSGLVTANFLVTVDDVTASTTWVESATISGQYTGTLASISTDEVVVVQLWDATTTPETNAIIVGDDIYQSNALTATVVI
jgi:hypothetical protein